MKSDKTLAKITLVVCALSLIVSLIVLITKIF